MIGAGLVDSSNSVSTHTFAAMGSTCSVSAMCRPSELGGFTRVAEDRAADLEAKWSRFRDDSELSRLNQAGRATLSHDTMLLVDRMVAAWRWTGGQFDPTMLHEMIESGYDRSFDQLDQLDQPTRLERPDRCGSVSAPDQRPARQRPARQGPERGVGCGLVQIDLAQREVVLPPGCGLDPGGIGKGLAADLIAEELIDNGASGVCVSMGGDIRALGDHPGDGWPVGIAHWADSSQVIAVVQLDQHGLATSNRTIRTWMHGGEARSHLLRPGAAERRATPVTEGRLAASVLAGQAWWAEVLTKVAMVGGAGADARVAALGGELLTVEPGDEVRVSPGWALT